MTQQELDDLPIIQKCVVLWQEEDQPTSVTDTDGRAWMVGSYEGIKYKREMI